MCKSTTAQTHNCLLLLLLRHHSGQCGPMHDQPAGTSDRRPGFTWLASMTCKLTTMLPIHCYNRQEETGLAMFRCYRNPSAEVHRAACHLGCKHMGSARATLRSFCVTPNAKHPFACRAVAHRLKAHGQISRSPIAQIRHDDDGERCVLPQRT